MKKPLIGISGSIIEDKGGMFPGYKRSYVNDDYVQSILRAGGIPIILPIIEDKETIQNCIEKLDGIILSGGHDVNPLLYNEEPNVKLTQIFPERDEFDFELIKLAKEKKISILGICRGMQILNTYHGGSNYQDNSYCESSYVKHWQGHTPSLASHTVNVSEESRFYDIFGSNILVNSFHHQSVKKVGTGLIATVKAKDGIVELIESDSDLFMVGFQWHPEMMSSSNNKMQNVFVKFIESCK